MEEDSKRRDDSFNIGGADAEHVDENNDHNDGDSIDNICDDHNGQCG